MRKICTRRILCDPYINQRSNGCQGHVACVGIPCGHPDQDYDRSMYVAAVANYQCYPHTHPPTHTRSLFHSPPPTRLAGTIKL